MRRTGAVSNCATWGPRGDRLGGSFSRAARRLGYSQSAISQQVAALERIVGHRVLERSSGAQAVIPTAVGKIVLEHGEQIARQIASARAEVEAFAATGERAPDRRVAARQRKPARARARTAARARLTSSSTSSRRTATASCSPTSAPAVSTPPSSTDRSSSRSSTTTCSTRISSRSTSAGGRDSSSGRSPSTSRADAVRRPLAVRAVRARAGGAEGRRDHAARRLADEQSRRASAASSRRAPWPRCCRSRWRYRTCTCARSRPRCRPGPSPWRGAVQPPPRPTVEHFLAATQTAATAFRRTRGLAEP